MNTASSNSTVSTNSTSSNAAVTTCPPDADGTQYSYNSATGMCNPVAGGGRRRKASRKNRKASRKNRKTSRKNRKTSRKASRKNRKATSRKGSRRN